MSLDGMSGRSAGSDRTPTIEAKVVILGTQGLLENRKMREREECERKVDNTKRERERLEIKEIEISSGMKSKTVRGENAALAT